MGQFVFITIVALLLGIIAVAVLKDSFRYPYLFRRAREKKLESISQLITLDQFEEAKIELQPLLEMKRGCKKSALCHVKVLRGTGEIEKALELAEKSARRYPEELIFRLEEATILLFLGRIEEALHTFAICEPILREEKEFYLFALAHFKKGEYEASFRLIEQFLATTQDDLLCSLGGDCKMHLKQFGKAIDLYNKALSLCGEDHALYVKLAEGYRRHGNLSQSERLYKYILEREESDVEATLGLAACMVERGMILKAYLFFQASKAWSKQDLRLYTQTALLAIKLKRFDEGEFLFGKVLEEAPPSFETLAYYGYCLEKQQKWQQAELLYLRLIALFPHNPHGYRALSWLFGVGLSQKISITEGLSMAHTALKLDPDSLSWEILSACEARAQNFVRAYQILESLAQEEEDLTTKQRLHRAMRQLRKNLPLSNNLILREKVA